MGNRNGLIKLLVQLIFRINYAEEDSDFGNENVKTFVVEWWLLNT